MNDDTTDIGSAVDELFEGTGTEDSTEVTELEAAPTEEAIEPPEELTAEEPVESVEVAEKTVETAVSKPKGSESEIPDGAKEFERNGKKYWTYEKGRGEEIYAGYKASRAIEEALGGESATPEAIRGYMDDSAFMQTFFTDTIADPQKAFGFLVKEGLRAFENGETDSDPVAAGFETHMKLVARVRPEIIESVGRNVLAERLDGMYAAAKKTGDKNLFNAAAYLEKHVFGKHQKFETYQAPTAVDAREQSLAQREQRIQQHDTEAQRRSWESWQDGTQAESDKKVSAAIEEAMAPYAARFAKFPLSKDAAIAALRTKIEAAIKEDRSFLSFNDSDYKRAQHARAEGLRGGARDRITARYAAKAKAVAKQWVQRIVSEQATQVVSSATAKHGRMEEAGKQKRQPTGAPAGAALSKKASPGYTRSTFESEVDKAFAV